MSQRGGRRKEKQKLRASGKTKPSWQPTLNHYFGGKSLPVQPTLSHFLKKHAQNARVVGKRAVGSRSHAEQGHSLGMDEAAAERKNTSSNTAAERKNTSSNTAAAERKNTSSSTAAESAQENREQRPSELLLQEKEPQSPVMAANRAPTREALTAMAEDALNVPQSRAGTGGKTASSGDWRTSTKPSPGNMTSAQPLAHAERSTNTSGPCSHSSGSGTVTGRGQHQSQAASNNPFSINNQSLPADHRPRPSRQTACKPAALPTAPPLPSGGGKRKSLSLKTRKRKLSTSPSKTRIKPAKLQPSRNPCTEDTLTSHLQPSSCPGESGSRLSPPCNRRSGLSYEDEAMMLQYCSEASVPRNLTLADLEDLERDKAGSHGTRPHSGAGGSPVVSHSHSPASLMKSTTRLPTSPTFSPHLHPLTRSPYPSSLRAQLRHTSPGDSSLPLFSPSLSPSPSPPPARDHQVSTQSTPSSVALQIEAATTSNGSREAERSTSNVRHFRVPDLSWSEVKDEGLEGLGMEVCGCTEGVKSDSCQPEQHRVRTYSGQHEQHRARRALFRETDKEGGRSSPPDDTPGTSANCTSHDPGTAGCCYSDESFSFSEFMSESLLAQESHDQVSDGTCVSCDQITCKSHHFNRYLVLESVMQECMDKSALLSTGRHKPEVKLRLFDAANSSERLCYLRDDWLQAEVKAGDTVQVNGTATADGCYVVDNEDHCSLVVNPDTLISGTTVATSISCARRAVLGELLKGSSSGTEAMVIGRMLHEVFQGVLQRKGEVPTITMATVVEEIYKVIGTMESLEQLYMLGMSEVAAVETLSGHAPNIVEWCGRFLHPAPRQGRGEIEFKRSPSDGDGSACVAVSKVLDIEENIWCPRFGLKGKVDVTVNIKGQWAAGGPAESFRAPLELKTGKMFRKQGSVEHRAQVTLYTMMLASRYGNSVPGGLLCYLKAGHTQALPSLPHEKRGLLIARNLVAGHLGNQLGHMTLPGMLREKHTCKYCPYLKQCTLYHKAVEHGSEETSALGELFSEATAHLPASQLQFFAKWSQLVLEEYMHFRGREAGRGAWLSSAHEREREGAGLADMLAGPAAREHSSSGRYLQTFSKTPGSETRGDLVLSANDRVVVSCQDGSKWAVAMGTITTVTPPGELLLLVDKPVAHDNTLYRLDEARSHSPATPLSNLTELCSSDSERDHCLRELVIDLRAPRFKSECAHPEQQLCEGLNASQGAALHRVLLAQDYALILGMPGSGKSTTIAHLVSVLVAGGNSVLITSYTHSAVDNILLKLKEAGIDFLRLGTPSRVHPSLRCHTPSFMGRGITTVHDLEALYRDKPVVATTCLGISHPLFSHRSFDYCIVDEASQITLPVSLGPLRHAATFVLVGDHYQLPPLVQSERAREGGLDVSLFRRLSEHHPAALVCLEEQYRMNSEIMSLSNHLIYNQRLRCGSVGVATARLHAPRLERGDMIGWLWRAVDPAHPVVFLNTDGCDAMETHSGDNICNTTEAQLVSKIVNILIEGGVPSDDIGVITPYRQQQKLIRETLKEELPQAQNIDSGVEVNTVDKYQGRDKACVLASLVRSNPRGNVGSLLQDWRRVNVALSRAKHKLVLIGSQKTLGHAPLLASLLQFLSEKCWIVNVM